MALKKLSEKAKIDKIDEEVKAAKDKAVSDQLTKAESEAIIKQQESEEAAGANTKLLQKATKLLSGRFNLDPTFNLIDFTDKGNTKKLSLENRDYIVAITIKDGAKHGLVIDTE